MKKLLRLNKTLALKSDGLNENRMAGDASGLGNMDSYSDVIFPTAFSQPVIDDFLSSGFIADAHDWSKVVGMPLVAEVRGNTVYTECEFHSTPDAQIVRTKCRERIDHNLLVGLSVGIGFYADATKSFANGAALLAYAESSGQDMSLFDVEGIKAFTGKCRAIIDIAKWYEYSPITTAIPANPSAWATSVKSAMTGDAEGDDDSGEEIATKGEFLGDYVLGSMTMGAINRANDALMYGVFYDAVYYDEGPLADRRAKIAGGLAEYSGLVLRVFDAIMTEDTEPDADDDAVETETAEEALKSIKVLWSDPKLSTGELPAGSFERQLKSTLAVVKGCQERAQLLVQLRKQDGRSLSQARREQIAKQETELETLLQTLSTLRKEAEVSPGTTESTGSETTDAAESEEAKSLTALRMKQLSRKNQARPEYDAPQGV